MTKHLKTLEQTYRVLDEIEHVRHRVSTYAGSPILKTNEEYLYDLSTKKISKRDVSYIPALIKVVSEAIDNAVDEHKRNPKFLDTIKFEYGDKEISIYDNGGIPVQVHSELGKYVPEIIFGQLRSGSNYNDDEDQSLIGTNGLGVKLLNILSSNFIIETADGKNMFVQEFKNGMRERSEPKIKPSTKNFTKLTFTLDFDYFKIKELDQDHIAKIIKRLVDVAACNPSLKVYINGERLSIKSFEDYIKLYADDYAYDNSNENWEVAVTKSDGFDQVSFVNAVETYNGGTHIEYVTIQIVNELREYFKKKHKVDVKPADIRNHMRVFVSCSINRPKFSSQTKENLVSTVSEYGSSYKVPDKFIRAIIKSDIIKSVLDWVEAKARALELAELGKLNKDISKKNPKHIEKFIDATTKDRSKAMLFITEGDSASGGIRDARDSSTMGLFPLRGKPLNAYEESIKDMMANNEIANICTIVGLTPGVKVKSKEDIRFGAGIVISSDQDQDGFSIRGLLIANLYKFWPELFEMGLVKILNTPLAKVKYKGKKISFYSLDELEEWRKKNAAEKFETHYYKGLGSSSTEEWREYLHQDNLDKNMIEVEYHPETDSDVLTLLFGHESGAADRRKVWLNIEKTE